MSIFREFYVR